MWGSWYQELSQWQVLSWLEGLRDGTSGSSFLWWSEEKSHWWGSAGFCLSRKRSANLYKYAHWKRWISPVRFEKPGSGSEKDAHVFLVLHFYLYVSQHVHQICLIWSDEVILHVLKTPLAHILAIKRKIGWENIAPAWWSCDWRSKRLCGTLPLYIDKPKEIFKCLFNDWCYSRWCLTLLLSPLDLRQHGFEKPHLSSQSHITHVNSA